MKKKIFAVLMVVMSMVAGMGVCAKFFSEKLQKEKSVNRKNDAILKLYCQWMGLKQKGKSVVDYLEKKGYKSVAVYGMHYLGESLVEELANSSVEVKYGIDRNANAIYSDVNVVSPEEDLEEVDAVIVTAFSFFDEIEEMLQKKLSCPIISIEEIIDQI